MHPVHHLYVHVPFCRGKCAYCAFFSVPYDEGLAERYLDALQQELAGLVDCGMVADCETLYIGGGTPSVLSDSQWSRLLSILAPVVPDGVTEWTVEANPGTLTPATLARMVVAGVNRVSMGVQSFDDTVLAAMGRPHVAADVGVSVARARAAGVAAIGLDLIAGLPGVDAAGWETAVARAIALEPDHVSVYALGLEKGSALQRQVSRGAVAVPDDASVLEALQRAREVLEADGLRRYEISNYARPGRACRHNLNCWRGGDYVGIGPAASSRAGLERWTTVADVAAYCGALEQGRRPPGEAESVDVRTDLVERVMFGLRLIEGVPIESCCAKAGPAGAALWQAWQPALNRLCEDGLLVCHAGRWQATRRGLTFLDTILVRLVA